MSTSTDTGFSHVSVKELKDEFKKRKAKGFSNINKTELINNGRKFLNKKIWTPTKRKRFKNSSIH